MSRKSKYYLKLSILWSLFALVATVGISTTLTPTVEAQARPYQINGASIIPQNQTDFASAAFKQSVRNLQQTGASHVSLMIPWYQSNKQGHDIHRGHNTPTDDSLIEAINYIHSLGMKVMFKIHMETYDEPWRAQIDPANRGEWFRRHGDMLVHYGQIAQATGVDIISIGQEMIKTTADELHPENTAGWINMITRLRAVYAGKLTYGAHGNGNEDYQILFWDRLDIIGSGPYYSLDLDPNRPIESMMESWQHWDHTDILPLAQRYNKPYMFVEIGYRSIAGSNEDPWNWARLGPPDMTTQAQTYEALLRYWQDQPHYAGTIWWNWNVNPNAGGHNDTRYTPQNKPAEEVLRQYWGGHVPQNPVFRANASVDPINPNLNSPATVSVNVQNTGAGTATNSIVLIEVYNSASEKVHQQIYEGEGFAPNQLKNFNFTFTPTDQHAHAISIGVFNHDWTHLYQWWHHIRVFNVAPNESTLRITSPIPSTFERGSTHYIRWTDTANSGTYNLLLRGGGQQYAINWHVTGDELPNGERGYLWRVGDLIDGELPIPGRYTFTICHNYTAPCATSINFDITSQPISDQSTINVTSAVPSPLQVDQNFRLSWTDTAPDNGRDNVHYNILLRSRDNPGAQYPIEWYLERRGNQGVIKTYDWTVGNTLDGEPPIPGNYFLTVCHDYQAPCAYSGDFRIERAPTGPERPVDIGTIDNWWPVDGATMHGTQPFKALVPEEEIDNYEMYWQVDGDRLNDMHTSHEDWPHKVAWINVSDWNWRGDGPYLMTYVAKKLGEIIARKSFEIMIARW
jgi:hypothetical protein